MLKGTYRVKTGFAEMFKGGVIMDVTTPEQAQIAEEAGAVAVMALERVPADIRAQGGVARMADPKKIKEIMRAVSIPVMAKCRIGHIAEARILEALGVDFIDESEVLTPADPFHHIDKWQFKVPFVCGCRDLGEACRRLAEGAAMLRTKGEAGTGNVVEAVRHMRILNDQIRRLKEMSRAELVTYAKEIGAPVEILEMIQELGRLPVVNFAAGGIATPADAALKFRAKREALAFHEFQGLHFGGGQRMEIELAQGFVQPVLNKVLADFLPKGLFAVAAQQKVLWGLARAESRHP